MTFRKSLDELCKPVTHADVATALKCSVATIRQARMEGAAKARRTPPADWQAVFAKVATAKAERLSKLAKRLLAEQSENYR